jgi:hypothetical protein
MRFQLASKSHRRFALCLTALLFTIPTVGFLVSALSH